MGEGGVREGGVREGGVRSERGRGWSEREGKGGVRERERVE